MIKHDDQRYGVIIHVPLGENSYGPRLRRTHVPSPYADLHVHTTRSDGTLEPDAVADAARRAGVSVVAITDHDVLPPFEGSEVRPASGGRNDDDRNYDRDDIRNDDRDDTADVDQDDTADVDRVTVVAGVELRVEPDDGERLDLLGYGVHRKDDLEDLCAELGAERRKRGQRIVDLVEDCKDVTLDIEVDEGTGRPHVARAIDAHPAIDLDYQDAFDELIGSGCPCYVKRRCLPSFERGHRLLAAACDVVSLAHPLRYADLEAALERAKVLDAIELEYPYTGTVDLSPVERAIADHDLLATGGSDAHGEDLGVAGLDRASYRRLASGRWSV